jgi:hypothetical protein
MKGLVSFHPVDPGFFDEIVSPLVAGRKIQPEGALSAALAFRRVSWAVERWKRALGSLRAAAVPPEPDPSAPVWRRLRQQLEALDFRPPAAARRAAELVEPQIHLEGRPFFIVEGSAERVAEMVDRYLSAGTTEEVDRIVRAELRKLDPQLAAAVEPDDSLFLSPDLHARADLLGELKTIYDLAAAARENAPAPREGEAERPAVERLIAELPWRALRWHARVHPFWIARDADGLETISRAAGILPPAEIVPAWRLFAEACEAFPGLRKELSAELRAERGVGGFVAPGDIPRLLDFLERHGSRIIAAATRHGEGASCAVLLKKMKECAVYAARKGRGYLEGSGIGPFEEG